MALIKGSEVVKKLKALRRGQEVVINGDIWMRLDPKDFKCSPRGLAGDYDTKASFVAALEVADEFPVENVFQFDEVP